MSRKLLVILLVLGLLVGIIGRVPVARANSYAWTTPLTTVYVYNNWGTTYQMVFTDGSIVSGDPSYNPGGTLSKGTMTVKRSWSIVFDGVHYDDFGQVNFGGTNDAAYSHVAFMMGVSNFAGFGDDVADTWSVLIDGDYVESGNTHSFYLSMSGSGVVKGGATWLPLSVTLAGPATVDLVNGGTWTATATGGTAPYTYYWQEYPLGGVAPYNTPFDPIGPVGATSYSHTWSTAGTYVVDCMVQDATGSWQGAWKQVTAANVVGSYHALFIRYGDLGQYVNVQVFDSSGNPVTIGYTSGTQYGQYGQGGGFAWYTADYEAVQTTGGSYTWKWTMAFTVGGIQLHPDADMWFQTAIHLAIPNIDLQVMHHWTGLGQSWDAWYGPTGNQLIPETPPTVTSTIPEWLQAVYDMFVRLFRYLFVPSSSDFSSQLASGWILITSPVPSISPQYTIPFPNPNHLLAETGDSINIDFSGIQSYSGYSTYKTIVQAVLDALLVFVIISLVA